jgi:tetratricopeptide (TPR) repeat protein
MERSSKLQSYFDRGLKAIGAQDYEGAAAWFASIVEIDPTDKESLEYYEKSRMLDAQKGINIFKRLWYQLAGEVTYGFHMNKAASHYLGILSMDKPHKAGLAARYGKTLAAIGQPALASLAYRRALKFLPNNKSILKGAGPAFEAIDDRPAAIEVYHQLSRLEPLQGHWSLKVKDLSAAHYGDTGGITNLKHLRAEEERKAIQQQSVEGREDRIKELLDEYKSNPEEKKGLLPEIGRLLVHIERYDNALPIWSRVAEAAGKEEERDERLLEEAASMTALCYEKKGNLEKAEEGYQALLEKHPADPRYLDSLYSVRLQLLDRQIEGEPENIALIQKRADLEREHLDMKVDIYRGLVEKRAGDPDLLLSYGKVLAQSGNLEEAIPIYQKASQNPARAYPALRHLAWLFIEKGQLPLAIDTFKRALEKAPHARNPTAETKDIWYGLGEAYFRQGDTTNAKEWWKNVYECDIEFRDVKERYERLVV